MSEEFCQCDGAGSQHSNCSSHSGHESDQRCDKCGKPEKETCGKHEKDQCGKHEKDQCGKREKDQCGKGEKDSCGKRGKKQCDKREKNPCEEKCDQIEKDHCGKRNKHTSCQRDTNQCAGKREKDKCGKQDKQQCGKQSCGIAVKIKNPCGKRDQDACAKRESSTHSACKPCAGSQRNLSSSHKGSEASLEGCGRRNSAPGKGSHSSRRGESSFQDASKPCAVSQSGHSVCSSRKGSEASLGSRQPQRKRDHSVTFQEEPESDCEDEELCPKCQQDTSCGRGRSTSRDSERSCTSGLSSNVSRPESRCPSTTSCNSANDRSNACSTKPNTSSSCKVGLDEGSKSLMADILRVDENCPIHGNQICHQETECSSNNRSQVRFSQLNTSQCPSDCAPHKQSSSSCKQSPAPCKQAQSSCKQAQSSCKQSPAPCKQAPSSCKQTPPSCKQAAPCKPDACKPNNASCHSIGLGCGRPGDSCAEKPRNPRLCPTSNDSIRKCPSRTSCPPVTGKSSLELENFTRSQLKFDREFENICVTLSDEMYRINRNECISCCVPSYVTRGKSKKHT